MSKTRAKPDRAPSDIVSNGRTSSASFDGSSTWSPSKFRKSLGLQKGDMVTSFQTVNLERLAQETSKSPVSYEKLVGNKEYSDIAFLVGSHVLYAHKVVIEARCPNLLNTSIKDRGRKGPHTTLKVDEKVIDVRGLHLILEYVYTGTVPFLEVNPAEIVVLMSLSELYQIERLTWLCERYTRAVLNNELFFTLLRSANNANVTRAKNLCLDYGGQHFRELIIQKEAVHSLGIELFREMVVHAINTGAVCEDPEKRHVANTIKDEFKILFVGMPNPDAQFSFKDDSTPVSCHKAILYAHSEKLKPLLSPAEPAADGKLTLPKSVNMSSGAFKSMLGWIYHRDLSFGAAHAAEMVPFAREYEINALVAECDLKIRKGIAIDSVLPILSLCYSDFGKFGYKKDLATHCINYVVSHFGDIDLKSLKWRSSKISADIAAAIRQAVISGAWKAVDASADTSSEIKVVTTTESEQVDMSRSGSKAELSSKEQRRANRKSRMPKSDSASSFSAQESIDSPKSPKAEHKSKSEEKPKNEEPKQKGEPKQETPVASESKEESSPAPAEETAVEATQAPATEPKEEKAQEEPSKEESVKEEPAKEESSKEEPAKEESTKEEPAKEESSKGEPAKGEPSKEESPKEETPKEKSSPESNGEPAEIPVQVNDEEKPKKSKRGQMVPSKSQERVTLPEIKLRHVEPKTSSSNSSAGEIQIEKTDEKGVKAIAETFEAKSRDGKDKEKRTSRKDKEKEKEKEKKKDKKDKS